MGKNTTGRMINQDISMSSRVGSLSPHALSLFCLLIPHFNAHGKMLANPLYIKGLVCPLVDWMTPELIHASLIEISDKTNVKFWQDDKGIYYLHSLNWKEHQDIRSDRLGPDRLPNFTPGLLPECPGLLPLEVEVEVEVEKKTCVEPTEEPVFSFLLKDGSSHILTEQQIETWEEIYVGVDVRREIRKMSEWCLNHPSQRKTKTGANAFVTNWLNRSEKDFKGKLSASSDSLFDKELERSMWTSGK